MYQAGQVLPPGPDISLSFKATCSRYHSLVHASPPVHTLAQNVEVSRADMAQACLVANEAEGSWHIRNEGCCTMLHACASILLPSPDIACAPALLRSGSRFQESGLVKKRILQVNADSIHASLPRLLLVCANLANAESMTTQYIMCLTEPDLALHGHGILQQNAFLLCQGLQLPSLQLRPLQHTAHQPLVYLVPFSPLTLLTLNPCF